MRQAQQIGAALFLAIAFMANPSWGQAFPTKPIRVYVGIPVGGASDLAVRAISTPMSQTLGQPVIVENRVGANSTIAAGAVLKAEPDGHTLYFGSTALISQIFNRIGGIDARTELSPVSNVQSGGYFAVIRTTLPINSLQELLAYSKANEGKLNFGSASALNDMIMTMVKSRAGLSYTSIPYKGPPEINTALLSGQIDFTVNTVGTMVAPLQAGAVRPLFVTSGNRMSVLPNVPTLGELGINNFEVQFNVGLWSTPRTPRETINTLNAAAVAATKLPAVTKFYKKLGAEAVGSTPEEQVRTLDAELRFWIEAARVAKFVPPQ